MQRLSKTLFGQRHRLEVMIAIAESDGLVNPGDLAEQLGFRAQSAVQAPLRDLTDAGLLMRLPTQGGRVYLQRVESTAWQWSLELRDACVSTESHAEPP
jgi:predicted transcriptional regulator